jgi:hypothetical protein
LILRWIGLGAVAAGMLAAVAPAEATDGNAGEDSGAPRQMSVPSPLFDGAYGGRLAEGTVGDPGGGRVLEVALRLVGSGLSGQVTYPQCGAFPVALAVSPSGEISGAVRTPQATACLQSISTVSGRVHGAALELVLQGPTGVTRGTLLRVPEEPSRPVPAGLPTPSPAAGLFNGFYAGALTTSSPGGQQTNLPLVATELRISGDRLTGRLVHPQCGDVPFSLPIAMSGAIGGRLHFYEPVGCSLQEAAASGRVATGALILDIHGSHLSARGSLSRRAD